MRMTIDIDDELLAKAMEYSGITDITELLHEALKVLIASGPRRMPGTSKGPATDKK
jgi:Arc/MetJ family transcription regulator